MFYQFNSLLGRLSRSCQATAYNPQGVSTKQMTETFFVMDSKKTPLIFPTERPVQSSTRGVSVGKGEGRLGIVPADPGYKKIMEMQNLFLKDDGILVWLKRGARDRIGYYATMGLAVSGTVFAMKVLFDMSFPKK